ncbi:hypothetical protein D5F01_LYC23639 [Larimichthys crocea]|uniref:Uncharacterized protein n=1 Tax=Larimichthys crocea TaxID=215358 RepID=A0A6G0HI56_LARCR|nr:hypothetical protein D5F01_LYC23631 [Larimichthys crocea]KAE8278720.1 hypothetical protein D5F01_LYC23639 [Larimichthys crocea]
MAPYFSGKSRGSKLCSIVLGTSMDSYVEEYGQYIFAPKAQQRCRRTLCRRSAGRSYPAVLRKAGLAPTTIILYVGQAISFLEYFRATPPKHSRITSGQTVVVIRELRKLHKDLNRTVLGHQALIKQAKGMKLVPQEELARCQVLARAKLPSLLEDIEKAPPRDPKTRYRFFFL